MPRAKRSRKFFFYLARPGSANRIRTHGIRADYEGHIHVCTDMLVANTIACNQLMWKRYSVFRIDPAGVTGPIVPDDVAEFSHEYQRVITQPLVLPAYLKMEGTYDSITDRPTKWDFVRGRRAGQSDEEIVGRFEVARYVAEQKKLGQLSEREIEIEANHRLQLLRCLSTCGKKRADDT